MMTLRAFHNTSNKHSTLDPCNRGYQGFFHDPADLWDILLLHARTYCCIQIRSLYRDRASSVKRLNKGVSLTTKAATRVMPWLLDNSCARHWWRGWWSSVTLTLLVSVPHCRQLASVREASSVGVGWPYPAAHITACPAVRSPAVDALLPRHQAVLRGALTSHWSLPARPGPVRSSLCWQSSSAGVLAGYSVTKSGNIYWKVCQIWTRWKLLASPVLGLLLYCQTILR